MTKLESLGSYSFIDFDFNLNYPENILNRIAIGTFDDIEDAHLYATIIHELTHKLQNLASSYGIWKTRNLLLGAFLINHVIKNELKGIKIRRPIDKFIPRVDDSPDLAKDKIKSYEKFWIPKIIFEKIKTVDGPTAPKKETWNIYFRNINTPKGLASPKVKDKTTKIITTFGTKDILDGHARMQELLFIWNAKDISKTIAKKLNQRLSNLNSESFGEHIKSKCLYPGPFPSLEPQ